MAVGITGSPHSIGIVNPFDVDSSVISDGTEINVTAYGALGNGSDATAAFIAAWNAAKARKNCRIKIPAGSYVITSALPTIYHSDVVSVKGDGWTITKVYFAPTVGGLTGMAFEPQGYSTFDRLSVGGFALYGTTSYDKTLLRITAAANLSEMYDLVLQDDTDTNTIALRWEGWDQTTLRNSWIRAKRPIVIAQPSAGTLVGGPGGLDHATIRDCTIWSQFSTHYLIEMSDASSPNVSASMFQIQGHNAWVGGKGGIHFTGESFADWLLQGIRWEGNATNTPDGTGYFFDIEPQIALNSGGLTLIDVRGGVDHAHDCKFRNLTDISFLSCKIGFGGAWAATEVVLDMDATVDRVHAKNSIFTIANFSINSALELRRADTTIAASYNSWADVFWAQRSSSGAQYDLVYEQGVAKYRLRIATLAVGATQTLLSISTNNYDPTPGMFTIAAEEAGKLGGGYAAALICSLWYQLVVVTDSPAGIISLAAGTPNKLCVYRAGANIIVENNLAVAMKINVLYN